MKLALECRTDLLKLVQPFADFDFILAHKYLEDKEYATYYQSYSNKLRYLDNSTNELGHPMELAEMEKVAKDCGAHYIIAPDWIGEIKKTMEGYVEAVKLFGEDRTIGVVQGSNFEEVNICLMAMSAKSIVAVPYDICSSKKERPEIMGLRRALLVSNIANTSAVHLLGFNCIEELAWYKLKPNVMSIDTGVPIMLGLKGGDILEPLESKEEPTLNIMDKGKLTQEHWTAVCRNIALLRRYA
jgi:hypothetical protein